MAPDRPLIVGIGASAGGITAMEGFFRHVRADSETAFVVVNHLSPDRECLLHQVIARQSAVPVEIARDGTRVEPAHVYVMPENAILTIWNGRLRLRKDDPVNREHKPVDVFFSSLAEDQGENAIGIVLSGDDGDGTLGVKAIKAHGGITFAQLPDGVDGPRNPEMPDSAISSGLIDLALPVDQIGAKLEQIERSRSMLDVLEQGRETDGERLRRIQDEISQTLRGQTGYDFSGYKGNTFLRRVGRRMQVLQHPDHR